MALRGKSKGDTLTAPPTAVVAAASTLAIDGTSWGGLKLGDQAWQEEAWRHYDICGEGRYLSNWMGNAVSRCRLEIVHVDEAGRAGDAATDEKVIAIAENMFGGPTQKTEAQKQCGLQLYVAGETYTVAETVTNSKEDRWYVVSTSEIRRTAAGIEVKRSEKFGGGWYQLKAKKDLLIRSWTPHPRYFDQADSSWRAALPIFREIEQLTKKLFAQIDSRLAGAGLMFLPEELEFPPSEPDDPPGAAGLMATLRRAMEASLRDQGNASALVPIMVQIAGEYIDKIKWLTFETPFQAETLQVRDSAIRRLALSLDAPPEVLLGQGSANHWGAWQIEESVIKLQVEPLLARIADSWTIGYLRPALKAIGEDPSGYMYRLDPSPLAIRPDRQRDAIELQAIGAVGLDTVRKAGNWSEDDAPNKKELEHELALKLITATPALLASPDVQKALGIRWDVSAALGGPPADGAAPPEGDQAALTGQLPPEQKGLPAMPEDSQTPAQEAALLIGADLIVTRALEMANKKLLTRGLRGQFANIPARDLHTAIIVAPEDATALVEGRLEDARALAYRVGMDPQVMVNMLSVYTAALIANQEPHDYDLFAEYVSQALDLIGHDQCGAQFCRNPLHPGPCKGWKLKLKKVDPDRLRVHEERRRAGLHARRQAREARMLHKVGRVDGVNLDRPASAPAAPRRRGRNAPAAPAPTPAPARARAAAPARTRRIPPHIVSELRHRPAAQLTAMADQAARIDQPDLAAQLRELAGDAQKAERQARFVSLAADIRESATNLAFRAKVEDTVKAIWTGEHHGFKSTVTDVRRFGGQAGPQTWAATIEVTLQGRRVGSSSRVMRLEDDGKLTVEHAFLALDRQAQGGGFSRAYNDQAIAAYRAAGVKWVDIHANIDVGGYAWARQGFDFADYDNARIIANRARSHANRMAPGPARDELLRLANRVTPARWAAGTSPTSLEFAMAGHTHRAQLANGQDTWAGKQMMLGSNWYGRLPITATLNEVQGRVERRPAAPRVRNGTQRVRQPVLAATDATPMSRDTLLELAGVLHGIWTEQVADQVAVNPEDRHDNADGQSDYNEHHHDVSATAAQDGDYSDQLDKLIAAYQAGLD
jgi:hypothetical protein